MSEETAPNTDEEGEKFCPLIKADCLLGKCAWFVTTSIDLGGHAFPSGKACAVSPISRIIS
jgi:hypothetical protein